MCVCVCVRASRIIWWRKRRGKCMRSFLSVALISPSLSSSSSFRVSLSVRWRRNLILNGRWEWTWPFRARTGAVGRPRAVAAATAAAAPASAWTPGGDAAPRSRRWTSGARDAGNHRPRTADTTILSGKQQNQNELPPKPPTAGELQDMKSTVTHPQQFNRPVDTRKTITVKPERSYLNLCKHNVRSVIQYPDTTVILVSIRSVDPLN